MVVLTNAVDTWVNGNPAGTARDKNYGTSEIFRTRTVGYDHLGLLHFGRPGMPAGATIISATLRMRNVDDLSESVTLNVRRVLDKWKVNRVTWRERPGVTGAIASINKSGATKNTEWAIDVKTIMQDVANGAPWWGFQLSTDTEASIKWHSAQASRARLRPSLEVVWATVPIAPTMLSPSSGRAVDKQYPDLTFDFTDPRGGSLIGAQIQIAATSAELGTATDYDTGVLPISVPTFYTNPAATGYVAPPGGNWSGITANATRWWRVKVQRDDGQWSDWSVPTSFRRVAKPALNITNPPAAPNNFVWEPTPPFTWTFSGQKHYQALVVDGNDTTREFWNSGKITSSVGAATPEPDKITDVSLEYELVVRAWDPVEREQNGSSPVYQEARRKFTYNHDSSVTGVSGLSITPNYNGLPIARLTWARATAADSYAVRRDGQIIKESLATELLVGSGTYVYDDMLASARENHVWEVVAIVNGRESNPSSVEGSLRLNAPLLMRLDGTDPIMFLNPKRERRFHDNQALHEVMADDAPPVLITQSLGGMSGHVEGLLTSQALDGVTARMMRDRLKAMRKDKTSRFALFLGDETFRVSIFNVQWDYDAAPSELSYFAEFDWVVS